MNSERALISSLFGDLRYLIFNMSHVSSWTLFLFSSWCSMTTLWIRLYASFRQVLPLQMHPSSHLQGNLVKNIFSPGEIREGGGGTFLCIQKNNPPAAKTDFLCFQAEKVMGRGDSNQIGDDVNLAGVPWLFSTRTAAPRSKSARNLSPPPSLRLPRYFAFV